MSEQFEQATAAPGEVRNVAPPPIGDLIRHARERKGYSIEKVGDLVCRTSVTVHRWETGFTTPPPRVLDMLAVWLEAPELRNA